MDEKNLVIFFFMMFGLKYYMCSKVKIFNIFFMVFEYLCICL